MHTPTTATVAPWERPGHFQPQDSVTSITLYDTGHSEMACTVVSDGLVLIRGSVHQTPVRIEPWPAQIRHTQDCAACEADIADIRLTGARNESAYLSQWSEQAHERFAAFDETIEIGRDDTGESFAGHADVPDWLRTATAGLLQPPEAGAFQIARVWDRIDWPTLIAQHPGEVTIGIGSTGYGPAELTWEMVVTAFRALEQAGFAPALDVDLVVDVDATLMLQPSVLYCAGTDTGLQARVSELLGGIGYDDFHPGWSWC